MAFAKDFNYNGRTLLSIDPDLIVVSFDSTGSSESGVVARNVQRSPIMYDDSLTYDYGAVDSDIYRFSLTVARMDGDMISQELARSLISWLLSPAEPMWLSLDRGTCATEAMYDNVAFKGRFISASYEQARGYGKYAMTFQFENISPYGFTPQYSYTINLEQPETEITLNGHGTNVGKLVTPIILLTSDSDSGGVDISEADNLEFEEGNGQIMSIHNTDGNTAPFLIQIPSDTTVAIIGDNCYYWDGMNDYDTNNMDLYSFNNLANFNWPRMVSGANNHFEFVGTGTCQIIVRYFEALGV